MRIRSDAQLDPLRGVLAACGLARPHERCGSHARRMETALGTAFSG
jgi:hypothetical protein